jgi:hypothetical protein
LDTKKKPTASFTKADLTDFVEAALSRKDVKRVQFWLDQGIDPDVLLQLDIPVRQTVLTRVLMSGMAGEFNDSDVQIVRALLDAGANANGVIAPEVPETAASRAPLLFFVLIGFYDISQSVGDEVMDALLAHGADVNLQTRLGETALMVAAENNRVSAVQKLLARGADARLTRSDGKTAERIARDSGLREVGDMIANYQSARRIPR